MSGIEAGDEPPEIPYLNGLAIEALLSLPNSGLIVRTVKNAGRVRDVAVTVDGIEAVNRHGRVPVLRREHYRLSAADAWTNGSLPMVANIMSME